MLQKRQQEDGKAPSETNSPDDKRRRVTALRNEGQEDLIRRVVKEELALDRRNHLESMMSEFQVAMMQSVQHLVKQVQEAMICTVREEVAFALGNHLRRMREEVALDLSNHLNRMKCVVQEPMEMLSIPHLVEPVQESKIRRVEREEIEHFNCKKRTSGKEVHSPESRLLKLKFCNNPSLSVFTEARIEGPEASPLTVALIDTLTDQIVDSGPVSSAKVEIVVLTGDFHDEEGENWTLEEFKVNIVRERPGKKPLLTGDTFLTLKKGIGLVGEITFTDNSSWMPSRRFKLGARVVDNSNGITVIEAKTESFIVKDHRGKLYKKHHPPSLADEVWRLEKIGKDGAFHKRLSQENVNTVKDFLTLLVTDSPRLRHILGTTMSQKMWEVTVEHAWTCVLDKKIFLYSPANSQQKSGVVFNVVGQVMGLLSECQYDPIDKLSETEKADAQNLVISAFQHWEEVVSFHDEASLMGYFSHSTNVLRTSSSPRMENSNGNRFLDSDNMGKFDFTQPNVSSANMSVSGLDDDNALHSIENMFRMENSNWSSFLASDNMVGFDFTQPNVSSANITPSIPPVGSIIGLDYDNALHSIENMGRMENSNGSRCLASDNMVGFDFTQPSVSCANFFPSVHPVRSVSGLDDDNALHNTENMSPTYNQTGFPAPVTDSLICDMEYMSQDFCLDDLGYFDH